MRDGVADVIQAAHLKRVQAALARPRHIFRQIVKEGDALRRGTDDRTDFC